MPTDCTFERESRNDEEVTRIFTQHCRPCNHFDAQHQTCTIFGCHVRQSGTALLNKIKMGTEYCPVGKW